MAGVPLLVSAIVSSAFTADVPVFVDGAGAAGLLFTHQTDEVNLTEQEMMTHGVAVADFDRDGSLDLFVAGGQGQNCAVFINDGSGHFTDMVLAWQVDLTDQECSSVSAADINGDGYPDVYVGTLWEQNHLLLNSGRGTFIDTGTASNAVLADGDPFSCFGAAFGDVDLDGDLDLVTADWLPVTGNGNRLFLNNGDATFVDGSADANIFQGPTGSLRGFSPALVDMNGDGYPEMVEAADFGTSTYYANNGDLTFIELPNNGTGTDENGMGSTLADYDNDGDLDWFVTSIYDDDGQAEGNWGVTGNRLYRNEGNHQFTDVTDLAGVRIGWWGWGTSFADYNHDGLLDLAMTNGFLIPAGFNPDPTFEDDPAVLWLNTGDFTVGPTFENATQSAGFIHTAPGKGLVSFDCDQDGDLDTLISTNHEELTFFNNQFNPSADRWLQVDLAPLPGNAPDGIGARVRLVVDGNTYHRTVFAGPSFMCSEPLRLHFGFPAAGGGLVLEVDWPDGSQTIRHNVTPGRILRVRVGDMDEDGVADLLDWSQIAACVNGPSGDVLPESCFNADLDVDGDVDVFDGSLFQIAATP